MAMIGTKHRAMAGTAAGRQVTITTKTRAVVARISTLTETKLKISTSVTTDHISKMEADLSVIVIIRVKAMVKEVAITIRVMAGDSFQSLNRPWSAWDMCIRRAIV